MLPALPWLVVLLALALPASAGAFSVPNHRALTEAALDAALEAAALPQLAAHRAAVVEGCTSEDLNLHVKWTGWHHFFRPDGTMESSFRRGSAERVRSLWEEAEEAASHGDLERAFDRVGHLAHHIQDMAVPLHVVPVNHGPFDGFEQYELRAALARTAWREVPALSGEEAHRALALETLEAVRTEVLPTEEGALPWSAFWTEPSEPGAFGGYGEAGNAFGAAVVRWRGRDWRVARAGYDAFVGARAEAAVAYTRAFLVWASGRVATLAELKPSTLRRSWKPSPELSLEGVGGMVSTARGSMAVAGVRGQLPLPWDTALSLGWMRGLERASPDAGGWSLMLLSPPLLAGQPGYQAGLELRATLGAGLFAHEPSSRPGLALGLRARALLGSAFLLSAEAQYQAIAPPAAPWAHRVSLAFGVGLVWGDR